MGFFKRFGIDPLQGLTRGLSNPRPDLLTKVSYQTGASDRGLSMLQLNLTFQQRAGAANPEMSLALLLDRSGSMTEAFAEEEKEREWDEEPRYRRPPAPPNYASGHVYQLASTILSYAAQAGQGFDLVFYDDEPSFAGHIRPRPGLPGKDLLGTITSNAPRGRGTFVTEALKGTVQRYRTKHGIYIIVITDGEFADKAQAQAYIVNTLLPQLTPDNPYAFRLHFVGAGEEVDREFLQQLETAAAGPSLQMVKHHHHTHLRHSHDDILRELDRAFIGVATDVVVGEPNAPQGGGTLLRVGNLGSGRWFDGPLGNIGFLPIQAQLGLEFTSPHPPALDIVIRYTDAYRAVQEIPLQVPLPRITAATPAGQAAQTPARGFHLPWRRPAPEAAARQAAAQEAAALALRIQQVRQAEQERQVADLQVLGRGGIPTMAQQRLAELRADRGSFTSDLSPDEAALLRRNGFQPLGLVCGSAMYHVGTAYASAYNDCEVTVLSQAYNEATRLAVSRMQQEATALGAHGVVGVRYDIVRREWSEKSIEVQLIGTAIAGPARPPAEPWLSDLSGQEWWALHRAGYDPAALVYGNCTWFILTTQNDEWTERSFSNQELTHFSRALQECRNRANGMIKEMARRVRAVGVVGVHLSRHLEEIRLTGAGENPAYEREHHNLTLSMVGTAVHLRPDAPPRVRASTNVLSLRDGRIIPARVSTTAATFE